MTDVEAGGATRYAGARIPRIEDARLLTGRGTYVDDVALPGMLHACFVRSPFARAAIRGIDTAAARALPGVRHVFSAADLNPGVHEQWHTSMGPHSPETPRPPLAEDQARFAGDPVALVLADSRYVAEDAADLVEVDWEPLPAVVDYAAAEDADVLVHEAHGSNLIGRLAGRPADAEAFAAAAHVADETIRQQAYAAVPLEARGLVVAPDPATGDFTIHAATQAPHEWRAFCSRLLGVPEHRVRVVIRDTGGGFGQKVMVQREDMCVMLAAPLAGAPVKWVEDRRENLLAAGKSRQEQARARIAFDAEGAIVAADIDFLSDCGAYPTPWPLMTAAAVGTLFPGPYRVPAAAFAARVVYTNTAGRVAYRGPWQFETLAREVLVDIAARDLGIDPVDLRRRNLLAAGDLPYTNPNGMTYDRVSPRETLEQAVEMLGYDEFRADQAAARAEGRYLGVGVSTYVEPSTPGYGAYATEAATIRIEPSGKVNVYIAGGSTGNSLETTVVQLAADALGVPIEDVATIQGDTALTGFGAGAAGSRSGSMTAGAVRDTAAVLRERIAAIAAHKLEAAPEDIELAGGRAAVRGTPARGLTMAEVAGIAYFDAYKLPPGVPAGLEASTRYTAEARTIWVNATHLCTCEVDVETGRVRLLRYIVSEDCGPMINPNVVEGQIAGGAVQGIGGVLFEHLAYDEHGNPVTTTLMDYLLPTAAEVPTIEYGHIETPGPGPGGYKGVGEGGAIGAPAAVVNAVADALAPFGVRITDLPLTPHAVLALIDPALREGLGVKPAPFEYDAPTTPEEAVALLAEHGDAAKVLAGGQSLIPMLALRLAVFDRLVDVGRIPALTGIERRGDALWIGAGTTDAAVERSPEAADAVPLLARATPLIGHIQIRNRGTVGGSLAHADPAAEYPAVALALDAELEVLSPAGVRTVAAADFFKGLWTTVLGPDDLLVGMSFPVWRGRCGYAVEEFARRHGDFAIAGAAVAVELDSGGAVARSAVALIGMASTPVRATAAEALATATPAGEVDPAELGRMAAAAADPPSDLHGSAAYRRRVCAAVVARAWSSAVEEARRG